MRSQSNIVITTADNKITASQGVRAVELLTPDDDSPLIAARMDNEIISLNRPLMVSAVLEPITLNEAEGVLVYRRSLCFLMEIAGRKNFPERRLVIDHALGHGVYYHFDDAGKTATKEDCRTQNDVMQALVSEDRSIDPDLISWTAALTYFQPRSHLATVRLLEELHEREVPIWRCASFISLRHSPLAHRTGVLQTFDVELYSDGFLLRYPSSETPRSLGKRNDQSKLFTIYEEHKRWGRILGVNSVGQLNSLSRSRSKAREFIQTAEALHDRKIAELVGNIVAKQSLAIMIAGPSSSGKTTFTKKLALNLRSAGVHPQLISLDNYYREHSQIPRDEDDNPDFEILEALEVDLFKENLQDLLSGRETEIPIFDFKKKGERLAKGRRLTLDGDGVLLIEGIHGLNPKLTDGLDKNRTFKIYISALTQLNLDDYNRISTTDNRLIRRIVRDYQFRRYQAADTLRIWPSVKRGEKRHIFPHQKSADAMFNSALDYELAVLKVFAEPLLHTVRPDQREYGEAGRLMAFLKNFFPLPVEEVPEYSILREFIGRSGFRY